MTPVVASSQQPTSRSTSVQFPPNISDEDLRSVVNKIYEIVDMNGPNFSREGADEYTAKRSILDVAPPEEWIAPYTAIAAVMKILPEDACLRLAKILLLESSGFESKARRCVSVPSQLQLEGMRYLHEIGYFDDEVRSTVLNLVREGGTEVHYRAAVDLVTLHQEELLGRQGDNRKEFSDLLAVRILDERDADDLTFSKSKTAELILAVTLADDMLAVQLFDRCLNDNLTMIVHPTGGAYRGHQYVQAVYPVLVSRTERMAEHIQPLSRKIIKRCRQVVSNLE